MVQKRSSSTDSNYLFLSSMNRFKIETQQINITKLNQKIQDILTKLTILDKNQILEWIQIKQSTIYQLAKCVLPQSNKQEQSRAADKVKIKALKQHLRILVFMCYKLRMQYAKDLIMQIIKKLYFMLYKQQIFPQFQEVDYSTHQFKVLYYPPQRSFFDLFCCVQEDAYS